MINKNLRKYLDSRNINEILIWSWNNPGVCMEGVVTHHSAIAVRDPKYRVMLDRGTVNDTPFSMAISYSVEAVFGSSASSEVMILWRLSRDIDYNKAWYTGGASFMAPPKDGLPGEKVVPLPSIMCSIPLSVSVSTLRIASSVGKDAETGGL